MPITTLINYLQDQSNYHIGSIHPPREEHPKKKFNLYARDSHGNNPHPYHIFVSFNPKKSTIFFSVYYERGNWENEWENARKRSDAIQLRMHNDSRWDGICKALKVNANWFGKWEKTGAHGHCKFTFDHDNNPPDDNQLKEIKNLIDLIFTCFG